MLRSHRDISVIDIQHSIAIGITEPIDFGKNALVPILVGPNIKPIKKAASGIRDEVGAGGFPAQFQRQALSLSDKADNQPAGIRVHSPQVTLLGGDGIDIIPLLHRPAIVSVKLSIAPVKILEEYGCGDGRSRLNGG